MTSDFYPAIESGLLGGEKAHKARLPLRRVAELGAAAAVAAVLAIGTWYGVKEEASWEAFVTNPSNACKSLGKDQRALEPMYAPEVFECNGKRYARQ